MTAPGMSERNDLMDLIADAYGECNKGWLSVAAADAILAAGYRKVEGAWDE